MTRSEVDPEKSQGWEQEDQQGKTQEQQEEGEQSHLQEARRALRLGAAAKKHQKGQKKNSLQEIGERQATIFCDHRW